jgi:hypothetical protein
MPKYKIKAPNGFTYKIDGPDGASQDEVIAAVLAQHPEAGDETSSAVPFQGNGEEKLHNPSIVEKFGRNLDAAKGERLGLDSTNDWGKQFIGDTGIPNIAPARILGNVMDIGAVGVEAGGAAVQTVLKELGPIGEAIGALGEAFPMGSFEVGGPMALGRMPKAGRLSPDVEAGLENLNKTGSVDDIMAYAEQNNFGLDRQAVSDFVKARDSGKTIDPSTRYVDGEDVGPVSNAERVPSDLPEAAALEAEAKAFKGRASEEPTLEHAFKDEVDVSRLEKQLQEEAAAFKSKETPKAKVEVEAVPDINIDGIVNNINDTASKWKNSPQFEVHKNFDDFDEPNAVGVFDTETGSIRLNAKAIAEEADARGITPNEMTNTVMFHEGLGHFGLQQKFGQQLDGILNNFYTESVEFKNAVNDWIKKNPETYLDENQKTRAAEEVLAEMSEKGTIPPKLLNKIKNYIKAVARKMGVKLDYSMREIKTILSQVHEGVVNGVDSPVQANGQRFMMRRYGESKGPLRGPKNADEDVELSTSLNNYRSDRAIEDIMEEGAPEKTVESFEEWIDKAGRTKMTANMARSLAKGVEVPEFLAAKQKMVESANRIHDLSRKAARGQATERDVALLGKEIERHRDISKAVYEVRSNAARITAAGKIEVGSDKALSDGMLRMMNRVDLNDPDAVLAMAKRLEKLGKREKMMADAYRALGNALNLPRSLMSSLDLSAPLRQGVALVGTKELWKNVPGMFKMFARESNFDNVMQSIKDSKNYKEMQRSGLAISDLGSDLTKREEAFISQWAEKIPVIGRGVRASERAYTGFLNKLRADTFDSLLNDYKKAGIEPDVKQLKDISNYINNATGRGSLGKFDHAAPILSGVFFSPRLMASRVNMLNPVMYAKLDPVVRKRALKNLASFGGIALTVTTLAKLAGADVEANPTSSDFAKIKVGDTRYDILGGFGQYLTLGARLVSNSKKNAKGEVQELGKGITDSRLDVAENFLENKFSPVASFVRDYLEGANPVGEKFDMTETDVLKNPVTQRFIPLLVQDSADLVKDQGVAGIPMSLPGVFGVGMSTYPVHLGYDGFGRDIKTVQEQDPPSDAAIDEVARLNELSESPVLPAAPKSVRQDGEKIPLSQEQTDEWQRLMGEATHAGVMAALDTEEYTQASDDEKIKIIKEIHEEAYQLAKDEVLIMPTLEVE